MNPVMSVEEARCILGDEAIGFTDQEIEKLIDDLCFMADMAIKHVKKYGVPKSPVKPE